MPTLVIICGTSFSGKTTLGHQLAARFNLPEVDVDLTKELLFGEVGDDDLSEENFARIYRETDRMIEGYLASSRSVIDASRNFTKRERLQAQEICDRHDADMVVIYVDTPVDITRQRLLANRNSRERRDVSDAGFEAILTSWEPPTADEQPLIFRHSDTIDAWIEHHRATFERT